MIYFKVDEATFHLPIPVFSLGSLLATFLLLGLSSAEEEEVFVALFRVDEGEDLCLLATAVTCFSSLASQALRG